MTVQPRTRTLSAWRLPAMLGLIGTTLLAIYPFAFGYLPLQMDRHLGFLRGTWGRVAALLAALAGVALLTRAWLLLHPRVTDAPRKAILCLWSLPLLAVPPIQSGDAYAYAAQAWVLHQGLNPYEVPQGIPGPFAEGVWVGWAQTTAVYPPLALFAQVGALLVGGLHPYWSVVAMRLMAVVGVAICVILAPALARDHGVDPDRAEWAVALSPLTVVLLIGGAHNDALMLAVLAVALWAIRRPQVGPVIARVITAGILIGIATSFKQAAVIAAPGIVLAASDQTRSALRRFLDVALAGVVGGATFLGISFASGLGLGWMNDTAGNPANVGSYAPLSWIWALLRIMGLQNGTTEAIVVAISLALTAAGIGWALWRWGLTQPLLFAALALLAFGLGGRAMQPWYFAWAGFFLAFTPLSRRARLAAVFFTVAVLVSALLMDTVKAPVVGVGIGLALVALVWRRHGAGVRAIDPQEATV